MSYHPPKIDDTGTKAWIDGNTKIGYEKFVELVSDGLRPAQLARKCNKDSRTITDWLNRIARDNGHENWRGLYN